MKSKTGDLPFLFALIAGFNLVASEQTTGQVYTILHSFPNAYVGYPNSDGSAPYAGLVLSSNTLYGTTFGGGSSGNGTVFKVKTDGSDFTVLYNFTGSSNGSPPYSRLLLSSNTLYGTARYGGKSGNGTIFAVNTDGTGFTNLWSFTPLSLFTNGDGADPYIAGLILSSNTLYGTAGAGGTFSDGTVFAINTDGSGFTNLHSFNGSDGRIIEAALALAGDTLYGAASAGGASNSGTIFKLNVDSTGFTNLYNFSTKTYDYAIDAYTNGDGGGPGSLILLGDTLYGEAAAGGVSGSGTVFEVNTDGTGFKNLHSFALTGNGGHNSDGSQPDGILIAIGDTLYGTTYYGGVGGEGTVFSVSTGGTDFTSLHSFAVNGGDGQNPQDGLVCSETALYATTTYGGISDAGTVFSLSFAPQMTMNPSESDAILSWPTNNGGFDYTGFALQYTTNLVAPAWGFVSSAPVVISGRNTVTNPISGAQMFYRLAR